MLKKARGKVVCREESDACVGNCIEKEKIVAIQERMLEAGKSGCIGERVIGKEKEWLRMGLCRKGRNNYGKEKNP